MGGLSGFAKAVLGAKGQRNFKGFLLSVDNLPPIFLRFGWNPETYTDDWDVEFAMSHSPMSRGPRIQWTHNGPRTIRFELRVDAAAPSSCWDTRVKLGKQQLDQQASANLRNRLAGVIPGGAPGADKVMQAAGLQEKPEKPLGVDGVAVIISLMQQLRLPKSQLVTAALSVVGTIRGQNGNPISSASNPAPPKCVLGLGMKKYVYGYVKKATPKIEKFDRKMRPTRVIFDIEFLVVPGSIIEKMEDGIRQGHVIKGLRNFQV